MTTLVWLVLALALSNVAWAAIVFSKLLSNEDENKQLKNYYVNQLQLQIQHTEEIIRKWKVDINDRDIKLAERDKQWKEYTETLTGKKIEA